MNAYQDEIEKMAKGIARLEKEYPHLHPDEDIAAQIRYNKWAEADRVRRAAIDMSALAPMYELFDIKI